LDEIKKEKKMSLVERIDHGAICRLLLNQPSRLNVLSEDLLNTLQAELDSLRESKNVRCVIISGAGNGFCAGHDLKEMTTQRQNSDGGVAYFQDLFVRCSKMMTSIQSLPQPVIAQVHGIATAAGCQLVASCDLAVADESARFGVNGVNIGLFCSTPMVALTRAVGRKRAFEMLVTGQFMEAKEAKEIGLINKISEVDQLEKTTEELAVQIANKLGEAVKIGKEAFYKQAEMSLKDAYHYTGGVMAENMMFEQTKKGIDFFLDKKTPEWDQ
jgi:enoyl-CoA hydratase/carnithine racemase